MSGATAREHIRPFLTPVTAIAGTDRQERGEPLPRLLPRASPHVPLYGERRRA